MRYIYTVLVISSSIIAKLTIPGFYTCNDVVSTQDACSKFKRLNPLLEKADPGV
jgi:hypothetical protein